MKKILVPLAVVLACAGCSTVDRVADRTAEANDKIVAEYQAQFCSASACAESRLACALPMGGAARVLTSEQLASVRAFIEETDGTCKRQ